MAERWDCSDIYRWLRRGLLLGGLLWVFAGFCSCRPPVTETVEVSRSMPVRIGLSNPASADAAQTMIAESLVAHIEQKGWQAIVTDSNRSSAQQAAQIVYLMQRDVRAVIAVPEDSRQICESVDLVRAAGLPFYTVDRAPLGCEVNLAVLSDNELAGRQAGEAMVRLLSERYGEPRGTVLEIQGDLEQNVALLRRDGFHAVIDRFPGIQVISRPTRWQASEFAQAVEEVLQAHPLLDGIYLHSDCVGVPAVLPVLQSLGRLISRGRPDHLVITGVDGCPETLQAIRNGWVDQASSQPFPDMGVIVEWIAVELAGGAIEPGPVVREGASWSPARIERGEAGPYLLLRTISVTVENVDDPTLWGNR